MTADRAFLTVGCRSRIETRHQEVTLFTALFTALGRLVVRRARLVLAGSLAVFAITAVLGVGVFDELKSEGFDDPSSESTKADTILTDQFGGGTSNIVLIATAEDGDIDDPEAAAAGEALAADLASIDGVDEVASYWQLGSPPLMRSDDGASALITAHADDAEAIVEVVIDELAGDHGPFSVEVGGEAAIEHAIDSTIEGDLTRAELIAVPITLVLLILVFRGLVAAVLPLLVGAMSASGAFFVLWAVAQATDVSVFSINLVTALALGLSIDYGLLLVSRFREELNAGYEVDDAIVRTITTAGRTVAFSALTVAVSLIALVMFPLYFLRSFAYAGIGVLTVAMLASIVTLPALLHLLGHRVNAWSIPGTNGHGGESRRWKAIAEWVLRRPAVVAVSVVALLIVVGLPFLSVEFGSPDARALPPDEPARVATTRIQDGFSGAMTDTIPVVLSGVTDETTVDAFVAQVSQLGDVVQVEGARGTWADGELVAEPSALSDQFLGPSSQWIEVLPSEPEMSPEAQEIVSGIRDLDPPFETAVGGETAALIDTKAAIFRLVPLAGLWIAAATFVLLFLLFGSFVLPATAIGLNTLSLTATFGTMVWIFQDGHFSEVLGFTATGLTDTSMPILMFAIAFGLSMDYEVFLLSRVSEEHDRSGDNHLAIVSGLARTGRIITAAALVLSVTFFAFATSGISFMKMFGLGLGVAVLVDAFLVRATLVPALMKLIGSANWWAPRWARRAQERIGFDEADRGADARLSEPELTTANTDPELTTADTVGLR
jgi:RND superfamily putative drug exporter